MLLRVALIPIVAGGARGRRRQRRTGVLLVGHGVAEAAHGKRRHFETGGVTNAEREESNVGAASGRCRNTVVDSASRVSGQTRGGVGVRRGGGKERQMEGANKATKRIRKRKERKEKTEEERTRRCETRYRRRLQMAS